MVIDKIRLENFKTHKDSIVEFSKITSIIGENGHGKTNLIKGLFLVLYNEDWPEEYIKHGEKSSKITVWLTNGNTIERSRSKSKQEIKITYADKSVKTFTGKNDAQSYVELASGISKIKLKNGDVIDLNYSEVRNKTSLLEGSSSTLAKRFSYLLKTEKVEVIKTETSKLLRENLQSILEKKTNADSLEKEISELEKGVKNLEGLNNQYKELQEKILKDQQLLDKINQYKDISYTKIDLESILEDIQFAEQLLDISPDIFDVLEFPETIISQEDFSLLLLKEQLFDRNTCPNCGYEIL